LEGAQEGVCERSRAIDRTDAIRLLLQVRIVIDEGLKLRRVCGVVKFLQAIQLVSTSYQTSTDIKQSRGLRVQASLSGARFVDDKPMRIGSVLSRVVDAT
jgi:hypothetical protein